MKFVIQQFLKLAALLHDIADSKFNNGDESIGPKIARTFLGVRKCRSGNCDHVVKIIENISYKGGNFRNNFTSIELNIVQDADRLGFRSNQVRERSMDSRIERSMTPKLPQTRR
jgi:HD superfamily phosphodiesterase